LIGQENTNLSHFLQKAFAFNLQNDNLLRNKDIKVALSECLLQFHRDTGGLDRKIPSG
jgi:hypothetical protein